jgi:hypothetical protein
MAMTLSLEKNSENTKVFNMIKDWMDVTGDHEELIIHLNKHNKGDSIFISPGSYKRGENWIRLMEDGTKEIGYPAA